MKTEELCNGLAKEILKELEIKNDGAIPILASLLVGIIDRDAKITTTLSSALKRDEDLYDGWVANLSMLIKDGQSDPKGYAETFISNAFGVKRSLGFMIEFRSGNYFYDLWVERGVDKHNARRFKSKEEAEELMKENPWILANGGMVVPELDPETPCEHPGCDAAHHQNENINLPCPWKAG